MRDNWQPLVESVVASGLLLLLSLAFGNLSFIIVATFMAPLLLLRNVSIPLRQIFI
jgi:hypothetical protein